MYTVLMLSEQEQTEKSACRKILSKLLPEARFEEVSSGPTLEDALDAAMAEPSSRCVIICAGDQLFPPASVGAMLARRGWLVFPGFGELARRRLIDRVGPAGMLCNPSGGLLEQAAIFVLPCSADLCRVAAPLIQMNLPHLEQRLHGPAIDPLTDPPPEEAELPEETGFDLGELTTDEAMLGGISLEQVAEEAAAPVEEGGPWRAALQAMGAHLDRSQYYTLPDDLAEISAIRQVLESAGERGAVSLSDGRSVGVFGFPDLLRPSSKVLMLTQTRSMLEVIALHRFPHRVGIFGRGSLMRDLGELDDEARKRTGKPTPQGGYLFAVDHQRVFLERDQRIWSWDGLRERDEGDERQAAASLLLRWSER